MGKYLSLLKHIAGGVDMNADDIQEWMNRDKGHWLTSAGIVDVMSHAGIGHKEQTKLLQ